MTPYDVDDEKGNHKSGESCKYEIPKLIDLNAERRRQIKGSISCGSGSSDTFNCGSGAVFV